MRFRNSYPRQYEVLAYDFIVDQNGKVWLVEINQHVGVNLAIDSWSIKKIKRGFYHATFAQNYNPSKSSD